MKAFNSWVARKREPSSDPSHAVLAGETSAQQEDQNFLRDSLLGQGSSTSDETPPNGFGGNETDDIEAQFNVQPSRPAELDPNGTRTRLLGFEKSDGTTVDAFSSAPASSSEKSQYPVGWVLVVKGPGRGHCFTLYNGMMQIGRGEDQAIRLNFGDTAISRSNHAAILFDPQDGAFWLGHGGKANIVRVNQKPLISNQSLNDGDKITIGETTLQLKTFCGPNFKWEDEPEEVEEQHLSLT